MECVWDQLEPVITMWCDQNEGYKLLKFLFKKIQLITTDHIFRKKINHINELQFCDQLTQLRGVPKFLYM